MNSRNKGDAGERELAAKLREYGCKCRRGQQYSGTDVSGKMAFLLEAPE